MRGSEVNLTRVAVPANHDEQVAAAKGEHRKHAWDSDMPAATWIKIIPRSVRLIGVRVSTT